MKPPIVVLELLLSAVDVHANRPARSSLNMTRKSFASRSSNGDDNGKDHCPCMGIKSYPGVVSAFMAKEVVPVPAEYASYCNYWDTWYPACECTPGQKETCKGAADFCKDGTQKWCYIDPCNCQGGESAVIATYFPSASFHGRKLYFSYETCGGGDKYTATFRKEDACEHKSVDECKATPYCGLAGSKCMGREIAEAEASCVNANAPPEKAGPSDKAQGVKKIGTGDGGEGAKENRGQGNRPAPTDAQLKFIERMNRKMKKKKEKKKTSSGGEQSKGINANGWCDRAGKEKETLVFERPKKGKRRSFEWTPFTVKLNEGPNKTSNNRSLWTDNAWAPFLNRQMRLASFDIEEGWETATNRMMSMMTMMKKPTFMFDVESYEETLAGVQIPYVIAAYISRVKRVICRPSGETCKENDEFAITTVLSAGENFIEYDYLSDVNGDKGMFKVKLEVVN